MRLFPTPRCTQRGSCQAAHGIIICGLWFCLAEATQSFSSLLYQPNPWISFDDFETLVGRVDEWRLWTSRGHALELRGRCCLGRRS
jgi:hypothetical protein